MNFYFLLPLWVIQLYLAYKVYGWLFAYNQGEFSLIAAESVREDRGMSLVMAMFVVVPVIGLPIAFAMWCMTGFAKYGWRA